MIWILVLAGFMAVFGVIGYLRGTKAAGFILLTAILGLLVIGPLGPTVIKYINAFAKGFRFLASGGMAALTGGGGADQALAQLQSAPPLVAASDSAIVLSLLYIIIVLFGLLLSGLPWFRSRPSGWGLLLGLIAGYLVGAVFVRALWPLTSAFLPLPFLPEPEVPPVIPTGSAEIGPSFVERLTIALTAFANSPLMPMIIAVSIVLFILIATRSSNKSAKG